MVLRCQFIETCAHWWSRRCLLIYLVILSVSMSSMMAEKIGMSDGGHFFSDSRTRQQISFNGIQVSMFSCGGWICSPQSARGPNKNCWNPSHDLYMLFIMFSNTGCGHLSFIFLSKIFWELLVYLKRGLVERISLAAKVFSLKQLFCNQSVPAVRA